MGTNIRADISKKNKYWIEKHRYYELKHFCLQYPIWKEAHKSLTSLSRNPSDLMIFKKTGQTSDPTVKCVLSRSWYRERMFMVERAAEEADSELSSYILIGVTEGKSYEFLSGKLNIPCSRDTYYDRYRRFFWILNRIRN